MNTDPQSEISSLRLQNMILLVCLIAVTSSLTAFFYQQGSQAQRELANAEQMVKDFNQNKKPVINMLYGQLSAFGKTHPDYQQQVLAKYSAIFPVAQ